MAGRGAVSQSGQGWFPQPWWLIARLRYCRPFTDLSPRSIALSHSLLQVILLATAAIIGAFSEHFSVSFVRSRSWIAFFTSLREGALSERISCYTVARACAAKGYCSRSVCRSVGRLVGRSVCLSVCVCVSVPTFSLEPWLL